MNLTRHTAPILRAASLSGLLILAGCANAPFAEPPRAIAPEEIVAMARKGDSAPTIIGALQKSRTVYHLTASQFAQLSRDGVPDAVLDFMQQTQLKEIESEARRSAYFDARWNAGWYGHPWHSAPRIVYVRPRVSKSEADK